MAEHNVQQQVMSQSLPSLLRDVYEGRLLLPDVPLAPWDEERRLKLFESIYHRLPAGSVVVWRTSQRLERRSSVGSVFLHEPEEARIRDYLVDGVGLVEALFLELGQAFWNMDEPARRPLAVSENPTAFVTFELETETFRMSRAGEPLQPVEFSLSRLLDAAWQHAFSATLRSLPMGQQLQSRFSRLVEVFFGASVAVIRVASEGSQAIQALLVGRGTRPPPGLVEQGPTTPRWYCDTCGQAIRHSRDGWVEWLVRSEGPRRIGRGFRLVHHQPASPLPEGCQYDGDEEYWRDQSILADVTLEDFLGHDGLTYLLEVLSRGELPQEQVVEMIKRLHTPGYERARFHAQAATEEGVIEPYMRPGFYWQRDIARVLDWANTKNLKP